MQTGTIRQRGRHWVVRYNEKVLDATGGVKWKNVTKILAPIGGPYRTAHDVRGLADELLRTADGQNVRPLSVNTVESFIEQTYFPYARRELKPSTVKGYGDMFRLIRPHLNGLTLRTISLPAANRILQAVADTKPRAHTTLTNVKNFMRSVWVHALTLELVTGTNPIAEAKIPKGRAPKATHAYTLDEIMSIIEAVDDAALKTALVVIAFTGLRLSELKGLKWDDFDGKCFHVRRGVWMGKVVETKTEGSAALVPCISLVVDALAEHRKRVAGDTFIFAGVKTGKPVRFENELRRTIKPALDIAKIKWAGWHAFRRGLATNLHNLGVDDVTTQAILRHADVATTIAHYIKPNAEKSRAALDALVAAYNGRKTKGETKGRKTA